MVQAMTSKPSTPDEVLVCDVCRQPIDDLGLAMVFWEPPEPGSGGPVKAFRLAHKSFGRRCDDGKLEYSAELSWFNTSPKALFRLAGMNYDYNWTAEQLARLIAIAWACSTRGE